MLVEHKSVFAEAIEPAEVISIFSKEINFSADRRKSELLILGALGLLRPAFAIDF